MAAQTLKLKTYRQMKSKSSIDWTALVCIPQTIALVVLLNNCSYFLVSIVDATDDWRRTCPKEIFVVNFGILFGLTTLASVWYFWLEFLMLVEHKMVNVVVVVVNVFDLIFFLWFFERCKRKTNLAWSWFIWMDCMRYILILDVIMNRTGYADIPKDKTKQYKKREKFYHIIFMNATNI